MDIVTISLCMIVKNEVKTLPKCLNSIKDLVDEIIIVDTGSIDNTKEIAYRYTDKVYEYEWVDDFSAARNFSFSKATKDYILWLDADDIILNKDREKLIRLKILLTNEFDAIIMKYVVKMDDMGFETYTIYRERLVKRENNFQWVEPIHEYLEISGKIIQTDIAVTHTKLGDSSNRNIKILKKLVLNKSEKIKPRYLFYYARELQEIGETEEAVKYYNKFLDMEQDEQSPYVEGSIHLAKIYMDKNMRKEAIKVLIRSMEVDPIHAEVLCLIGKHYLDSKNYHAAIGWFELALSLEKKKINWQFYLPEYWDFIPYLELSFCYYHLGDLKKAIEYHLKAQKLKPYHPFVIQNNNFYSTLLENN